MHNPAPHPLTMPQQWPMPHPQPPSGLIGATGTFTTADLKTVTVRDGVIVSIV